MQATIYIRSIYKYSHSTYPFMIFRSVSDCRRCAGRRRRSRRSHGWFVSVSRSRMNESTHLLCMCVLIFCLSMRAPETTKHTYTQTQARETIMSKKKSEGEEFTVCWIVTKQLRYFAFSCLAYLVSDRDKSLACCLFVVDCLGHSIGGQWTVVIGVEVAATHSHSLPRFIFCAKYIPHTSCVMAPSTL